MFARRKQGNNNNHRTHGGGLVGIGKRVNTPFLLGKRLVSIRSLGKRNG